MVIAYWIIAGILALVYLAAGGVKVVQPQRKLVASGMPWAGAFPAWSVKAIGFVEIVGAVGLIAPALTRIVPLLAPWAAVGLALVQVGAIITHLARREAASLPVNVALLLIAVAAAWIGFGVWS